MNSPPPESISFTNAASRRVHGTAAPIRIAFIRDENDAGNPPLASLLRGGRGGSVRLKLYLSMLWIARKAPHTTDFPAGGWATLLDLDDPLMNGARRINDAISWLGKEGFIRTERRVGRPSLIAIRDERGGDRDYEHPFKSKPRKGYLQLPAEFWTRGWIHGLSGSAVALFLVILAELNYGRPLVRCWVSPDQAQARYGLSPDTWTRATKELRQAGLIAMDRIPVVVPFDSNRYRNRYCLIANVLTTTRHQSHQHLDTALADTLNLRPEPQDPDDES